MTLAAKGPGADRGEGGETQPGAKEPGFSEGQRANPLGGSGDSARGTWCTPKWLAEAVGPWDLDPFSNPRSHIASTWRCSLEDGGDGLLPEFGQYRCRAGEAPAFAFSDLRVWIQPPYDIVLQAFRHYRHTRWCALLRFDPSTKWFAEVYAEARMVCVPRGRRVNFEPPPGVKASSNAYPHALFYRDARDVTDAVMAMCVTWRT